MGNFTDLLKFYDITEVISYFGHKDVLLASELKNVESMVTKQEKTDYLEHLVENSLDRLPKFMRALKYFVINAFASFQYEYATWKSLQKKKKKRMSSSIVDKTTKQQHETSKTCREVSDLKFDDPENAETSRAEDLEETCDYKWSSSSSEDLTDDGYLTQSSDISTVHSMSSGPQSSTVFHIGRVEKLTITAPLQSDHTTMEGQHFLEHSKLLPHSKPVNEQSLEYHRRRTSTDHQLHRKTSMFKELLTSCRRELIDCMDVRELLPYLHECNLVSLEEYSDLIHEDNERKRNGQLLRILPSKGEHALDLFVDCLTRAESHLGHKDLVSLLKQRLGK